MKAKYWVNGLTALLLCSMALPLSAGLQARAAESATATAGASVGKPAPAFSLTDSNGKKRSLADAKGKILVLEWVNYDCPFVKRQYSTGAMQKMQKTYTDKGVLWYSICSSADGRQGNYPPAKINELVKQNNATPTAYLIDEDGTAGHAYGAVCTPHMFIINDKGVVAYIGAVDDNQSADATEKVTTNYVQKALDEALANKPVTVANTKPMGCSVKYKSK